MYLSKRIYDQNETELTNGKVSRKVSYTFENVGYWRKFNALHNWFVNEVQGGEDDCHEYIVEKDQLKELLELLKKVKETYSYSLQGVETEETLQELLPTSAGFFFGSTEYDDYYIGEVDRTIEILESELTQNDNAEYIYQASW